MEIFIKDKNAAVLVPERMLTIAVFRDDDQFDAFCPELDLTTSQDTPEETLRDMVAAVREYAEDYVKKLDVYSKSPNRKHHLPLVQRIVQIQDDWEIRELFEVRYGGLYVRSV